MRRIAYDFHIHSCLSPCGDADMTPNSIAGMASLNGVRVAALTDHNTTRNCPAFFRACERYGVIPMAGMELTTLEDIHMICLFKSLGEAAEFESVVAPLRMKIKNRPDIFGEQTLVDENDCVLGREEQLLIPATGLDLTEGARIVRELGGAAFPAHIDRPANSLLSILGAIPDEPGFAALEVWNHSRIPALAARHRAVGRLRLLKNSDAHCLCEMSFEPETLEISAAAVTDDEIRRNIISQLLGTYA